MLGPAEVLVDAASSGAGTSWNVRIWLRECRVNVSWRHPQALNLRNSTEPVFAQSHELVPVAATVAAALYSEFAIVFP